MNQESEHNDAIFSPEFIKMLARTQRMFTDLNSLPRKDEYTEDEVTDILLEASSVLAKYDVLPISLWIPLCAHGDKLWKAFCPLPSNHPTILGLLESIRQRQEDDNFEL